MMIQIFEIYLVFPFLRYFILSSNSHRQVMCVCKPLYKNQNWFCLHMLCYVCGNEAKQKSLFFMFSFSFVRSIITCAIIVSHRKKCMQILTIIMKSEKKKSYDNFEVQLAIRAIYKTIEKWNLIEIILMF